jgi:hypothetical protein
MLVVVIVLESIFLSKVILIDVPVLFMPVDSFVGLIEETVGKPVLIVVKLQFLTFAKGTLFESFTSVVIIA